MFPLTPEEKERQRKNAEELSKRHKLTKRPYLSYEGEQAAADLSDYFTSVMYKHHGDALTTDEEDAWLEP